MYVLPGSFTGDDTDFFILLDVNFVGVWATRIGEIGDLEREPSWDLGTFRAVLGIYRVETDYLPLLIDSLFFVFSDDSLFTVISGNEVYS